MSFDHQRIINSPGSPNDGKTVWVDFEARGYNPCVGEWDENWVCALLSDDPQNGHVGSIEKKYLALPPTTDLASMAP